LRSIAVTGAAQQLVAGKKLSAGETEIVRDVTNGYHQQMQRRYREGVQQRIRELIAQDYPIFGRLAEQTITHQGEIGSVAGRAFISYDTRPEMAFLPEPPRG